MLVEFINVRKEQGYYLEARYYWRSFYKTVVEDPPPVILTSA